MPVKLLVPETLGTAVLVAGQPGAPGGPGGSSAPSAGTGWELGVYDAGSNYSTLLCKVPSRLWNSFTFSQLLNDKGSGTVVLNMDDPWWKSTTLAGGLAPHYILDEEHCFRVFQDGVQCFDFLGETITEQLIDASEQRLVTITGPGTLNVLTWAMAAPPGFPSTIVYKADALTDSFSAVNVSGQYIIDYGLWNASSNTSHISVNPSGSAQITGTSGGTVLGSTEWDFTSTLFSAQISPIVSPDVNNVTLNGSELTQLYIESLDGNGYYVMVGMSSSSLYAQYKGPNGTQTQVIASAANYAAGMSATSQYSYWQMSEARGVFYFWVSADGQTWTKAWQVTREWDSSKVGVYFAAQYTGSTTEFATITSLNSDVVTSSLGGATYLNQPIMGVYLQELVAARNRGTIPFVQTQMNTATDSFGNPWTDSQSVQIQNGTDLFSLLQGHASMVDASYIMQPGFKLVVGLPSASEPNEGQVTLGYDRSSTVRFYEAERTTAKTRQRQRNQIQNLIAAINSDSLTVTSADDTSIETWGQREAWVQAAAQVTSADLDVVASAASQQNADEVLSWTLQIVPWQHGKTVFKNFQVGDWVGLERPDFSAVDAVQVSGITVTVDQSGNETHELVLVSYVQWLEERLTYIATKMGGGYVSASGTTAISGNAQGSTLQAPTVFSQSLSSLGIPTSSGGTPLVYNPVTGQWVPAGSTDPTTGSEVPMSVAGPGGTTTVGTTGISVASVPSVTTALNANPTFAGGSTTGWTGSNATISAVAPAAGLPSQQYAGKITPTSSGVTSLLVSSTPNAPVQGGQPYTLFAYVNLPTQANMSITTEISWYDAKGNLIRTDGLSTIIPAGQWVQLAYQDTAPSNAVTAEVAIGPASGSTTNPCEVAAVSLVQGTTTAGSSASSTTVTPTGTTVVDATGSTRIVTGLQSDGTVTTNYYNGNAPAAPDTPVATAGLMSFTVAWDGLLGGLAPLSDFLLVQVHVSTSSGFTPSSATLYTVMATAGNVTVVGTAGTTYYVKLVAVNESGAASTPSAQASAVPTTVSSNIPAGSITAIQLAAGAGGPTVTIASTAPSSPRTGDLWYDTAAGNELFQYNGSSWTAVQYGTSAIAAGTVTASLIAANTITAAQIASATITATQIASATITASNIASGTITATQIASGTITATQIAASTITGAKIAASTITAANIAAGTITASQISSSIVIAGIVNGTTITGASIVADGSSGEVLVYSGTPASGNLIGSWSATSGTDSVGNNYPGGFTVYASSSAYTTLGPSTAGNLQLGAGSTSGGGLELATQSATPVSQNSILYADANGNISYRNGSAGWNGHLVNAQNAQIGGSTVTGTTKAALLTSAAQIPANDAAAGTIYRLTCWGYGTPSGTNTIIGFAGLLTGTPEGAANAAASVSSGWVAVYILQILTTGSSGTANVSLMATATGGSAAGANATTITVNTTATMTMNVEGSWGAGSGSSLQCYGGILERMGA